MKYKLFAFDMDGTVLNSQKKISPRTIEALNTLAARGIFVAVSSGRNLAELTDYREELKAAMRYGILISGGMIYDFQNDAPIKVHAVDEPTILKLIDFGLETRAMIHLHTIRRSVAREVDIQNMAAFDMAIYQDMFNRLCDRCDDCREYVRAHPGEVIKVNLYHRDRASRDRNFERMSKFDLTISFTERNNLEASPRGITKASGLEELCKFLGIDIADTVAIGDGHNDVEILQAAGVGVAMGNARDDIKQLADFVTADNDHDGVAVAIEKFF